MQIDRLFLAAIKAALEDKTIEWDEMVSIEEWNAFFQLASIQNVVPMVYQSVYNSQVFQETGAALAPVLKRNIIQSVLLQVNKTQEFLELYQKLAEQGLEPIVVKGIICRNMFPHPDNRMSGDEDLYIPAGSYQRYKEALVRADMELAEWDRANEDIFHEVSFIHKGGAMRIEVHKDLFDNELSAYKGMNELFEGSFHRSVYVEVNGVKLRTLDPSDHLLFLILHAFKHFVSSGFGIRQVCDMVVFANRMGAEIDWSYVMEKSKSINADIFAAAIFDVGNKYLGFDWEKAQYPQCWREMEIDSSDLLKDLLEAGIFGYSNMSRKHSSNMTLSAVSAQKSGKKSGNSLIKTIFPSADIMQNRYSWLKGRKYLLPIAWIDRILKYRKETASGLKENRASESIKIGNERIDLMKQYGIINE